jgi:hypothetical protein
MNKYTIEYSNENPKDYTINLDESLWDGKSDNDMVYLSDFLDELPQGCVFLKGVTGCGATTLALRDYNNCIIALPTRNTVMSKWVRRDEVSKEIISYDNSVLPIYAGLNDTKEHLFNYLNIRITFNDPIKIVCTYDQLEKVVMRLRGYKKENDEYVVDNDSICKMASVNYDNLNFRLYIDEVHQVLEDYKYPERRENMRGLLRVIKYFPNVTCMTATPLEKKYFFDEIKDLPVIKVNYDGFFSKNPNYEDFKRRVVLKKCGYLAPAVIKIVKDHLENKAFGNAHIFVNSVDFIAQKVLKPIMEESDDVSLFKDKIRVVCGDTETNEKKIRKAVSSLYKDGEILKDAQNVNKALVIDEAIMDKMRSYAYYGDYVSSINSPTKRINFYTKTAWLGADIFDQSGQIYIISDGAKRHTMADISTAYIQILGRIRDSRNNKVIYLYSENRYLSDTEDGELTAFEEDMENREENREDFLQAFSKLKNKKDSKQFFNLAVLESSVYLAMNKDGELQYDKYLQWNDEISYKIVNGQYRNGANLAKSIIKNGWEVSNDIDSEAEKLIKKNYQRVSFKKVFEEYVSLQRGSVQSLFPDLPSMIAVLESKEEYLHDAYHLLGEELVRALGYKRREIAKEIEIRRQAILSQNIKDALKEHIMIDTIYSKEEIEKIIEFVKSKLSLRRNIKISDYYIVNSIVLREGTKLKRVNKIMGYL